jgi:hypothetical protein
MHRQAKIFVFLFGIVILFSPYCVKNIRYDIGIGQVKTGQSKESVIELMGTESERKLCNGTDYDRGYYPNGNCYEIFAYYSFFNYAAVAFDKDGKVIKKYQWTFDDGYGRPHDLD